MTFMHMGVCPVCELVEGDTTIKPLFPAYADAWDRDQEYQCAECIERAQDASVPDTLEII